MAAAPAPGRARFAPFNPADPADGFEPGGPSRADPVQPHHLVAFGLNSPRSVAGFAFFDADMNAQLTVIGVTTPVRLIGLQEMFVTCDNQPVAELVDASGKAGVGPVRVGGGGASINVVQLRGGQAEGRAIVTARDGNGLELATLTVLNVARIDKPVSFTYLRDANGAKSGVASGRDLGDEAGLLAEVNRIYNRQTGIFFSSGGARTLHIPEFGAAADVELDATKPRTLDWTKIYPKHRDHGSDFNVFFVRNIHVPQLTKFPGGISEIVGNRAHFRDSIIDNRTFNQFVQSDGVNLAHELGHALGERHNSNPQSLMSEDTKVGQIISLVLALRMRDNLKRFTQK